jgi:hypothetical protein
MQTNNDKILIFGIDLSFNSTGICIYELKNTISSETLKSEIIGRKMDFYRIVYNPLRKINVYNQEIKNVHQMFYSLPLNFLVEDTASEEESDILQTENTVKGLMIKRIVENILYTVYQPNVKKIICIIENYVMPTYSGATQLSGVGGLIMLQGFIRELFIEFILSHRDVQLKFGFPTPSHNKYSFTKNGNATKDIMIDYFKRFYNGDVLLPELSHYKVDDLVDAFSLMCYGYKNILNDKLMFQTNKEIEQELKKELTQKKKHKKRKFPVNVYNNALIL